MTEHLNEMSYEEQLDHLVEGGGSRQQIIELMTKNNQQVVDFDALTPEPHRWVDRGLKMSCEGANHPHHQSWKSKPRRR